MIKNSIYAAALFLAAACPAAAEPRKGWEEFTSPEHVFTVMMPGHPQMKTQQGKDGITTYDLVQYTTVTMDEKKQPLLVLDVSFADYSGGLARPTARKVLQGLAEGLKAREVSSEKHNIRRQSGKVLAGLEFTATSDPFLCKGNIYIDKLRAYNITACYKAGTDKGADADYALASYVIH